MKKLALALLASLALSTGAQALETGVAPKVTELGVSNPTTGLYVGNSYSFYNCGVHGYVRGLTRAANRTWKARLQTISSGMLSWHNVEDYLLPHEMDTYVVKGTDKMFDVVFLQGMSSEPIAAKRVPTFRKYLAKHVETIRSKGSVPIVVVTGPRPTRWTRTPAALPTASSKKPTATTRSRCPWALPSPKA